METLADNLPFVIVVLCLCVGGFLLIWNTPKACRVLVKARVRSRYRGVRLVSLSHVVRSANGEYQPDGRVYNDSTQIVFPARVSLPPQADMYPITLALVVSGPDLAGFRAVRTVSRPPRNPEVTIRFRFEDLRPLFESPELWRAELWLMNTEESLGEIPLEIVTLDALLDDLDIHDIGLAVFAEGATHVADVVLPTAEAIAPVARVSCTKYYPLKFVGVRFNVDLVRKATKEVVDSFSFPMDLSPGEMWIRDIARQVAGTPISEMLGAWEFRFRADSRVLGTLPFTICLEEDIRQRVSFQGLDLLALTPNNELHRVGAYVYRDAANVLSPVVTLAVPNPSPCVTIGMVARVFMNDELVHESAGAVILSAKELRMVPADLVLPKYSGPVSLKFVVNLENGASASREVTVVATFPKCADVEGRLVENPGLDGIDFDAEAERILQEVEAE